MRVPKLSCFKSPREQRPLARATRPIKTAQENARNEVVRQILPFEKMIISEPKLSEANMRMPRMPSPGRSIQCAAPKLKQLSVNEAKRALTNALSIANFRAKSKNCNMHAIYDQFSQDAEAVFETTPHDLEEEGVDIARNHITAAAKAVNDGDRKEFQVTMKLAYKTLQKQVIRLD